MKLENTEFIKNQEVIGDEDHQSANSAVYESRLNCKNIEITLISNMYDTDELKEQAWNSYDDSGEIMVDLENAKLDDSSIEVISLDEDVELTPEEITFVKSRFTTELLEFNETMDDFTVEHITYLVEKAIEGFGDNE